jgi:hypothetical protein
MFIIGFADANRLTWEAPREPNTRRLQCILCGGLYSTRYHLRVHLINLHGHGGRPHPCTLCGKVARTQEALRCHYKRLHPGLKFP